MPSKKQAKPTLKKKIIKKSPIALQKEKVKNLNAQIELQKDKHLRLKAEFDNYRKRKDLDIIKLLKYDGEAIIVQFLTVLDDLGRMLAASKASDDSTIIKINEGIALILNSIKKEFKKLDVKSFAKIGDVLDTDLHDALTIRHEKNKNENQILEVFEKGYLYKDRVIRHAKVVVNQEPS